MRVGNGVNRGSSQYSRPVHPHACGERSFSNDVATFCCGSSPCVWGTDSSIPRRRQRRRFIPMRVGNGTFSRWQNVSITVHPHACGERKTVITCMAPLLGSSPCVWGTENRPIHILTVKRFIPMRVGNGVCSHTNDDCSPVHPHACGERVIRLSPILTKAGSSPCVWGTESWRL